MRSPRGQIMGKGQIKTTHSLAHTERLLLFVSCASVFVWEKNTCGCCSRRFIDASTGLMIAKTDARYFIRPLGCTEHHCRWRYIAREMPRCNYPDCAKSRERERRRFRCADTILRRLARSLQLLPQHTVLCLCVCFQFPASEWVRSHSLRLLCCCFT